jgi:ABC-type phosphate/phosphonate transport system substrate-binding protein
MAKAFLFESGLSKRSFSSVTHRQGHDVVVEAVTSDPNHPAGVAKQTVVGNELRVLHSYPVVGMPWVARSDLDPGIAKAVKQSLLKLRDPSVLEKFKDGIIGFKEMGLEAYEPIEPAIEKARLFDAK